jgi:hypothetical protein
MELGAHGYKGLNNAKSNLISLQGVLGKVIKGHTHALKIGQRLISIRIISMIPPQIIS